MKYKAWDQGQPDNLNGRENYLDIEPNGNWNDIDHNNTMVVGFICEWKGR